MKNLSFLLILMVFGSCGTVIKHGNTLYEAKRQEGGLGVKDSIVMKDVTKKKVFKGKVKVDGDKATVTMDVPNDAKVVFGKFNIGYVLVKDGIPADPVRPAKNGSYYFFNDPLLKEEVSKGSHVLRYVENSFAIQGMAIALKLRSSETINGTEFPSQVESVSSYALGGAFKRTWNRFNKDSKNLWGSNLNSFSLTTGPFIGLGSAGVKKSSNAPTLSGQDFTGLIWSPGAFVQIGYNNINLGWAVGFDNMLGKGSGAWIYDGKMWSGLIVSINIAKF